MADKGKTVADGTDSEFPTGMVGLGLSSSSSVHETQLQNQMPPTSKVGTHPGEFFASDTQPLWKGIELATKQEGAGGGNVRCVCKFCAVSFTGSYTRVKAHLLKIPGFGVRACSKITADKFYQFRQLQEHADALVKNEKGCMSAKGKGTITDKRRKTITSENSIETCFKSHGRAELDKLAGRFFYSSCIPFNVARNPHWKRFVSAVAKSNIPSYLPPGSEKLRTSILIDEKNLIEQRLASIMFKWDRTGVSIVSDGWTDIQRRPLINFIAIANGDPIFLKSIDASGEYKDTSYLKGLFLEVISQVGPDKVVQIITDNASVCKSAGLSLLKEHPYIFWTPCVAHTLNLALKDICTPPNEEKDPAGYELFSWIGELDKDAKKIRNFIVNHSHALHLFNKFSDLRLLRVAETRFASIIIMFKRLERVKSALTLMVADSEWRFFRSEDEAKAQIVKTIIVNDAWWANVTYFLELTEPIWRMLREVDTDKPMLHKVYEMWDNMIEEIQSIIFKHENKCVAYDRSLFFDRIHKILIDRWDKSNTPLHCMAHSLNPKYYSEKWLHGAPGRVTPNEDKEITNGRKACFERLNLDAKTKQEAIYEYITFIEGNFDDPNAEFAREDENISPASWWMLYGSQMPTLQKIARRLLSQPVTSSCCERNWSTYSHIHNIKRNKLTSSRAEDLVYVHSNLRLLSRKENDYRCGPSQYWDVDPETFDFEGDLSLHTANLDLVDPIIPPVDVESNDENIQGC